MGQRDRLETGFVLERTALVSFTTGFVFMSMFDVLGAASRYFSFCSLEALRAV